MLQKECRYDILVYGEKHVHVNLRRTGAYDAAGLFLSIKKVLLNYQNVFTNICLYDKVIIERR